MLKILLSKKGQLSMEFALLLAAAVATASIAGFYYLKTTKNASTVGKGSIMESQAKVQTKVSERVESVKEVLNNG